MNVGFSWVGFTSGTSFRVSSSWLFFLRLIHLAVNAGGVCRSRPACRAVAVRPVGGMKPPHHRKCLHCKRGYTPDHRSRKRQKYCTVPECRKASKAASQRNCLSRPENQNYFRGPESSQRVRQWRLEHPEHRRRSPLQVEAALQDSLKAKQIESQPLTSATRKESLQDFCSSQDPLVVGFMSVLTGCLSQEDIDKCVRAFVTRGTDILNRRKESVLCVPSVLYEYFYTN